MVRLNKYLAEAGIASRRKADEIIVSGQVRVNGRIVTELGQQIDSLQDEIKYHGRVVKPVDALIFMFNKPVGVTSTMEDRHAEKTIADYFKGVGRVYPVGRLDKDSEGLILVTNDGALANQLTHPRYEHEKEYEVVISRHTAIPAHLAYRQAGAGTQARKQLCLDPDPPAGGKPEDDKKGYEDGMVRLFSQSFVVDGYKTHPMQVRVIKKINSQQWLISLILKEGRKRQIRRVAELLDYRVDKLKRVRIGKLQLGDLPSGESRIVKTSEII